MIEVLRVFYAILAALVSAGFTTSLRLRWRSLARGERIIRFGLIVEHIAFVYGAYFALHHHLPASFTLPVVMLSMGLMLLGFADWILNDLLPSRQP